MLTLAERTGIAAYILYMGFLWNGSPYAIVPLVFFVMGCLIAPFITTVGFFLPIISRGKSGKNGVAITFDDGPDPKTTPDLLQLLASHRVSATFFVTGVKASAYPELIQKILDEGHTIGNHSYRHDPFLMFRSYRVIEQDIEVTQSILKQFGVTPLFFRPPAGISNPRLKPILERLNLIIVNYSCRAWDGGNRRVVNLSKKILNRIQANDIVLLHDIRPKDPSLTSYWLEEIHNILSGIKSKGLSILPLSELIGKPGNES